MPVPTIPAPYECICINLEEPFHSEVVKWDDLETPILRMVRRYNIMAKRNGFMCHYVMRHAGKVTWHPY